MSTKKTSKAGSSHPAAPSKHPAKLSRQQSLRPSKSGDKPQVAREERDSAKLVRMATHHHAPTAASKLTRKSTMRPKASTTESSSSSRPTRESSEKERRERKRRQNTESARRMRELRRKETEELEQAYDANELRINELELVADELSRELRRHNTISTTGRSGRGGPAFEVPEERPGWFGAPF